MNDVPSHGGSRSPSERLALLLRELERLYSLPRREERRDPPTELPGAVEPTVLLSISVSPAMFRLRHEMGPLLRRPWGASAHGERICAVLYVTSAQRGEGVSMLAREVTYAAAAMPFCRALLLDCNRGAADQSEALGEALPSVVESWMDRGHIDVVEVEAGGQVFHATCFDAFSFRPAALDIEAPARGMAGLYKSLRSAYNFIVVDCPPVLEAGYFVPIAAETPEILLVVGAERTRIPVAMRARDEIAMAGGRLAGVVMNRRRQIIPRLLDRHL